MEEIYNQFIIALYQWTSFQVGSFNLADMSMNFQNAFLDSSFVHMLQLISAIVTIALGVSAMFLVIRRKEFDQNVAGQETVIAETAGIGPLREQWEDIMRHVDSTHEGEWKFAVIEADTLTEQVLRKHFHGDTMGDILRNLDKTKLLSIEEVGEAHGIRNRLAHDSNYFLRHAEALRAVRLFESVLKELGAI